MANISFVLQSNFNSKQQSIRLPSFPIKLRTHPNFKIKCLMMNPNRKPQTDSNKISDVNEVICSKALVKLGHDHGCGAVAGSRGRMGGSSVWCSTSSLGAALFFDRVLFASFIILLAALYAITRPAKSTLIKLQVGLLATATSLQKDLYQERESADTPTPQGVTRRRIFKGATLSLLEHLDYCVSAYSSVEIIDVEKFAERYYQLLDEETLNETLVNTNNIKKPSQTPDGVPNEYIVVTIIVAAQGVRELPAVESSAQLKETLQKLASIPSIELIASTVFWTPEQENHFLTEGQLIKYYLLLHPV